MKRDGTESGISIRGKSAATVKEPHCLYPGDLYPYTRRPLFIIIDSDNSFVFAHIPKYFGQPLVILMSPQDVPQNFQGKGWCSEFTVSGIWMSHLDIFVNFLQIFIITVRCSRFSSTRPSPHFVTFVMSATSPSIIGSDVRATSIDSSPRLRGW